MKKKSFLLIFIIAFLALLLLSSCDNGHRNVFTLIELRLTSEQNAESMPLAGLSFYVKDKEYTTDENGFASVNFRSMDEAFGTNLFAFPAEYIVKNLQTYNYGNDTVFFTIYLALVDNHPNPNSPLPENPNNPPTVDKKISLAATRQGNNASGELRGYVMDIEYNLVGGVDVYFGDDLAYAGKTNGAGEFSLFYKDNQYDSDKVKDFLYFAHDDYKFKVFYKSESNSTFFKDIEVFVVAARKDSDFNMNTIVTPVHLRCSFNHSGVLLPPGYNPHDKKEEIAEAVEGGDVLVGVEIYLNGKLVSVSDVTGLNIDFLVPNTWIHLKKEGFSFVVRRNNGLPENLKNDSYLFVGYERFLLEFRGNTDNMEILLGA